MQALKIIALIMCVFSNQAALCDEVGKLLDQLDSSDAESRQRAVATILKLETSQDAAEASEGIFEKLVNIQMLIDAELLQKNRKIKKIQFYYGLKEELVSAYATLNQHETEAFKEFLAKMYASYMRRDTRRSGENEARFTVSLDLIESLFRLNYGFNDVFRTYALERVGKNATRARNFYFSSLAVVHSRLQYLTNSPDARHAHSMPNVGIRYALNSFLDVGKCSLSTLNRSVEAICNIRLDYPELFKSGTESVVNVQSIVGVSIKKLQVALEKVESQYEDVQALNRLFYVFLFWTYAFVPTPEYQRAADELLVRALELLRTVGGGQLAPYADDLEGIWKKPKPNRLQFVEVFIEEALSQTMAGHRVDHTLIDDIAESIGFLPVGAAKKILARISSASEPLATEVISSMREMNPERRKPFVDKIPQCRDVWLIP